MKTLRLLVTTLLMQGAYLMPAHADLVGYWNFDGSSTATTVDASVGTVDGILVGGAQLTGDTGGIQGGAVQITNGYVDFGNDFPSTDTFSVQAWVKVAPGNTMAMIPVSKHWSTETQGYFLSINKAANQEGVDTEGFYSANSNAYQIAVGGTNINDGLWHQLVGVYNNGTMSIYVDGQLAGIGSAGYANNAADFIVGGLFSANGTPENDFTGMIDDVGVWNNALTAADVEQLYESTVNAVPLPGSFALLGSGLLCFFVTRRHSVRLV